MLHGILLLSLAIHESGAGAPAQPTTLTAKQFESYWADLASEHAARAFAAILALARSGDLAVPLLDKHLQPVALPDQKQIALFIKDLENDRFAMRARAAAELAKLGELAEPNLRRRLADNPSLEVRRRIEQLLKQLQNTTDLPDALQGMRALEALEKIGTASACRLLQKMARGFPGSRLTDEARDALERLGKRAEKTSGNGKARSLPAAPRVDRYGDPLPPGAMVRLGTLRFRHPNAYGKMIFAPDGRSVLVCGEDVRLIEVKTGKVQRRLRAKGTPQLAAFSAAGKLVTVSALHAPQQPPVQVVETWDLSRAGQPSTTTLQDQGYAQAQAISADGAKWVVFTHDGALRVWDLASVKDLRAESRGLELKGRYLNQLAITPDGSHVAGGPGQTGILLWNLKTGVTKNLANGQHYRGALAFSPDGGLLVSNGSYSGDIRFWNTATGKLVRAVPAEGGDMYGAVFSPNGKTVASHHQKPGIWLWDPASGNMKRKIDTDQLNPHSLVFSPDSRLLAANFGAAIRIWDLQTGECITRFPEAHVRPVTLIAFSPKSGVVATVGEDNAVRLWDVAAGRQRRVFQHTNWVRGLAFSPDGKLLASSCFDDSVRVFDADSGREIYKLAGHSQLGGQRALQFSRDGRQLLSWGDDFYLRAWNMSNGKAVREFRVGPGGFPLADDDDDENQNDRALEKARMMFPSQGSAAFSPDARDFAIGGKTGIDFVSTITGKPHSSLKDDGIDFGSTFTFSPDGNWALVKRHQRFDVLRLPSKTWGVSLALEHKRWGNAPAISPDGRSIAITTGEHDERIELWEKLTGKKRLTLQGSDASVRSLAFAGDGRYLAAGFSDATALVWDLLDSPQGTPEITGK
jgi:WD40 repeat protein